MQMEFNITILISTTLCGWNYSVVIRNLLYALYWGNKNTNVVGIVVFPIASRCRADRNEFQYFNVQLIRAKRQGNSARLLHWRRFTLRGFIPEFTAIFIESPRFIYESSIGKHSPMFACGRVLSIQAQSDMKYFLNATFMSGFFTSMKQYVCTRWNILENKIYIKWIVTFFVIWVHLVHNFYCFIHHRKI